MLYSMDYLCNTDNITINWPTLTQGHNPRRFSHDTQQQEQQQHAGNRALQTQKRSHLRMV